MFLSFHFCLFGDVAFSEYFLYHCRFLFVRRVRRTFFPSGWCFSTLRPRAGFFTASYERIQSINKKNAGNFIWDTFGAPLFSHWYSVVGCLEFGVVINLFSGQRGRRGRNRFVTLTCVSHTLIVSCRCCYCRGPDSVKWLDNSSSILHQLVVEMTERNNMINNTF